MAEVKAASAIVASEVSGPSPAVMGTYARLNLVFERGEGSWLITESQADKLWHTSNLYRVGEQERLAERLCAATFADKVFFCNSGAEACEGVIKAARRYHYVKGNPERWRIITFEGAFHGRTLATLSAAICSTC